MKPGIKTTEFWLVIVANLLTQAGALDVPDKYKWIVTAATIIGYAISRGLAKGGEGALPAVNALTAALRSLSGDASPAAAPAPTGDDPTKPFGGLYSRQATP